MIVKASICTLKEGSTCNFNNPQYAFALSTRGQFVSECYTTINTNAEIYYGELPDSSYQNRIQLSSNTAINSTSSTIFRFAKSAFSVCNILELASDVSISWKYNGKQGLWKNDKAIVIDTLSNKAITPEDISGMNKVSDVFSGIPDIDKEMNKEKKRVENNDDKKDLYTSILIQYDHLISDASYKGINLLEGQYLKINFNEDRRSKIDVPGVKADSESLGIKTIEWKTTENVEQSISELEEAINTLRGYASQYGNYYSIVTTRQDFTENLINVLEEGADKLTLADMNQESANMLALQTAQQLAVNSLSLASRSAQSILKLF